MSFHTVGMKANPRPGRRALRFPLLASLSAPALLAGCVSPPSRPAPAPEPVATARPAPPPVTPSPDWRDRPATPGDWHWARSATGSDAVFADGQLILHCDPARRAITLLRAASAPSGQVPITIRTSETSRALTGLPVAGGVATTLPAADPLLDAMAFSRGRFAVEAAGTAPLYVPSWTEVSRVIEDCR